MGEISNPPSLVWNRKASPDTEPSCISKPQQRVCGCKVSHPRLTEDCFCYLVLCLEVHGQVVQDRILAIRSNSKPGRIGLSTCHPVISGIRVLSSCSFMLIVPASTRTKFLVGTKLDQCSGAQRKLKIEPTLEEVTHGITQEIDLCTVSAYIARAVLKLFQTRSQPQSRPLYPRRGRLPKLGVHGAILHETDDILLIVRDSEMSTSSGPVTEGERQYAKAIRTTGFGGHAICRVGYD